MRRACFLFPLLLLAACGSPTTFGPYPQNPAVSDAQGHPHDSTTFYFPAADSLQPIRASQQKGAEDMSFREKLTCGFSLQYDSYTLFRFKAPVLSVAYPGADTYRFLWTRSFERPVLLTLQMQAAGPVLRTQFLSKPIPVDFGYSYEALTPPEKDEARRWEQQQMADPVLREELLERKKPVLLLTAEETNYYITTAQWQRFQALLQASHFYQLPACQQPPTSTDGAYWLLEAHTANGYHMVERHSPDEHNDFRKACAYLIELSSARGEKLY